MIKLKQSTPRTLRLGPFLDATDGVTPETGLAGTMVVYLSKEGAAFAARAAGTAPVHDRDGFYSVVLDATDTGTLGELQVEVSASATHCPVFKTYEVVPANVFESLVKGVEWLEVCTTAPRVTLSGANVQTYKQDDTTLQFTNAGTFAAGADVLTALAGKT